MLKLYQFDTCPYCQRVRRTIAELGLQVEIVDIDPADRSEVIAASGQRGVPVLVDTDRNVVQPESTEIVAYLREHYGPVRS